MHPITTFDLARHEHQLRADRAARPKADDGWQLVQPRAQRRRWRRRWAP